MIQTTGVRFVAQDAASFMRTVRDANRAVGPDMERATAQGSRGLNDLTGSFLKALLGAEAIKQGLRLVANAVRGLVSDTLDAYGSYEALSLSIQSLVARELKHADATMSMTDAMAQAGPRAEELLNWIQQLAIASPFDMEGVAAAFRTAQAYGFTSAEAQTLTQVMVDFTTATGQGTDVMGRVAYALGQIRNTGHVLTQDLRQLMNAGVDVSYILGQMGYTLEDVKAGIVSSDAFLQQFVQTMESDFGGAGEKSQATLRGLINTLGDIKSIGLRELFGPAIEAALPYLSAFAQKLQQLMPLISFFGDLLGSATKFLLEHKTAILTTIGAVTAGVAAFFLVVNASSIMGAAIAAATAIVGGLVSAFTFLLSPIGLVATAVAGLAALFVFSFSDIKQQAGDFFSNFSGNLYQFGHDLIMALANGMAAAIGAVLDVLIGIGQVITYWLSPGSPPKLLPDIDQWGASAINEFLGGFSNADFGVFDELSSTMSSFIRSLDIGKTEFVPRIQDARNAVALAVQQFNETGQVGEDTFQAIANAVGMSVDKVKEYVNGILASEKANRALADAQAELNRITQQYDDQLKPIDDQLSAIEKQRQAFIDQQREAELQAILSDTSAPEDARMLAQLELQEIALRQQRDAIQETKDAAVDDAQTKVDAAQMAADAAQEQLNVQQSLIDAQIENNRLIKEQTDALKSLASAAGGAAGAGGTGGAPGGAISGISDAISTALGQVPSLGNALDGIKGKIQGFLAEIAAPFAGIGTKLEELRATWGGAFGAMGEQVGVFVDDVKRGYEDSKEQLLNLAQGALEFVTQWNQNIDLAKVAWGLFRDLVKEKVNGIKTDLEQAIADFRAMWGEGGIWDSIIDNAKLAISLFHDKVKEKMAEVKTAILDRLTEIRVSVEGRIGEFVQMGKDLIGGMIDGVKQAAQDLIDAVGEVIGDAIEWAKELLGISSPSKVFMEMGMNANKGMALGLNDNDSVLRAIEHSMGSMIDAIPAPMPMTYAPPATRPIYQTSSTNITGVGQANVNNGMDMAQLESLILRTVQKGMTSR